jgi:hypothetical protein
MTLSSILGRSRLHILGGSQGVDFLANLAPCEHRLATFSDGLRAQHGVTPFRILIIALDLDSCFLPLTLKGIEMAPIYRHPPVVHSPF